MVYCGVRVGKRGCDEVFVESAFPVEELFELIILNNRGHLRIEIPPNPAPLLHIIRLDQLMKLRDELAPKLGDAKVGLRAESLDKSALADGNVVLAARLEVLQRLLQKPVEELLVLERDLDLGLVGGL